MAVGGFRISTLTPSEKQLWQAFPTGALVDLRSGPDDGPHAAASWPADREIRAEVIVALMTGGGPAAGAGAGVRLAGARVTGRLALAHAVLDHHIDFEHCVLDEGLDLAEARSRSVRLRGCYFPWLEAERCDIRGELQVQGCRLEWLSLYAARVFEVEISGSTITAPPAGPPDPAADWTPPRTAVNGDLLVVDTAMYCHDVVVDGQFRLPGARIGGYLHLDGARIEHEEPDLPPTAALSAPGLRVETGLLARRGNTKARNPFTVSGGVDLAGAAVKGGLALPDAHLTGIPGGAALTAEHIAVEGGIDLTGITTSGALRLNMAGVVGPLRLSGARVETVEIASARIEGTMYCDAGFSAQRVDLRRTRTTTYEDDAGSWPDELHLDGFGYDDLIPLPEAAQRLSWLDRTALHPQPYEHLAARYRALGRDADSRRVLLAHQRRRRKTAAVPAQIWGLLQEVTVGYGYRPWLAGLWLMSLLAAGSAYFAAHQPAPSGTNGPHFNSVAYTLDLLAPVINLGQAGAWNPTGFGQALAYSLIICGWILATSLVAGITRVLVRP